MESETAGSMIKEHAVWKTTIWLQVINILFGKKPRCAVWFRNAGGIAPKSSTQILLSQVVLCQSSLGLFVHFQRQQKIFWIDEASSGIFQEKKKEQ